MYIKILDSIFSLIIYYLNKLLKKLIKKFLIYNLQINSQMVIKHINIEEKLLYHINITLRDKCTFSQN